MNVTRTLSPSQLRDLRAELEIERARLERSMGRSAAAGNGTSSAPLPAGATAAFSADDGLGIALVDRTRTRHDAIVDALRRLDEGEYGECAGCGQPIPFGRLLVMPETRHCVACGARA